jgi:hypothetical protein
MKLKSAPERKAQGLQQTFGLIKRRQFCAEVARLLGPVLPRPNCFRSSTFACSSFFRLLAGKFLPALLM